MNPTFYLGGFMTYEQFKEAILTQFQEHFNQKVSLKIQPILKNNDVLLDGLIIMEEEKNMTPTLYLNSFYEDYCIHKDFEQSFSSLLKLYEENQCNKKIDVSFFTDFEQVRPNLVFRLINYEKNEQFLMDIPYLKYLDFAITFFYFIHTDGEERGSIQIHNHHLQLWNLELNELYKIAMENTPLLFPAEICSLTEIMTQLWATTSLPEAELLSEEPEIPMYVLSNRHKLYGAASLLYTDVLQNFAEKLDSDFYLLPSSLHEVILVPTAPEIHSPELNLMVEEVNETQLSPEEILSDHIYYYSRKKQELSL